MKTLDTVLNKSSKVLKTDTKYLTKNGFWLAISHIITALISLGLATAFANLISPYIYGQYKYVISFGTIVFALSLTGMSKSIIRSVAQGYTGTAIRGFFDQIKWSVLATLIAFLLAGYYFWQEDTLLGYGLIFVGALTPLINAGNIFSAFLTGKSDFKKLTISNTVLSIIPAATLIGGLFITDSPLILIAIYFISYAATNLLLFLLTVKKDKEIDTTKVDRGYLPFTKHLSVMNILSLISAHIDKLLIFQFLGPVQLAIFAFAELPISQMKRLPSIIKTMILPRFSKQSMENIKSGMKNKLLWFTLFQAISVILFIIIIPFAFALLFPQYMDAVPFSQVYALVLLLAPLSLIAQSFLSHKKKKELYILKTVVPIVKIGLLFALLPFFGIWGVIFAILATKITEGIILLTLFKRL